MEFEEAPIQPRVILFGANGMLGSYVNRYLSGTGYYESIVPLTRKDYDITSGDRAALFQLLHRHRARGRTTVIINCAGVIPQTGEQDAAKYMAGNTKFPVMLDEYAGLFGVRLIHITTDCIFHGKGEVPLGGFREEDAGEAGAEYWETGDYGRSKRECEAKMVHGTLIRTSIIGEELKTRRSLIEYIKSQRNGKVRGYANHYWNGVTTLELAKIIHQVIEKNLYWKGPARHFFSDRVYSKYEIVKLVNMIYRLGIDVEEYHHPDGPVNKSLQTSHEEWQLANFPQGTSQGRKSLMEQIVELYYYGVVDPVIPKNLGKDQINFYSGEKPFPYAMIDNALNADFAAEVQKEILEIEDEAWDRYDNPFEQKYTFRDKHSLPRYSAKLFELLESPMMIRAITDLFSIPVVPDPYRHFWGIHKYDDGDYLDIHVDAGVHPKCGAKKQVTLGIYLSKDWKDENMGNLELWEGTNAGRDDAEITKKRISILPIFNRMILFECNDYSWHGNPERVVCKNGEKRIFVTMSYLGDHPENYQNQRQKAFFVPRPNDPVDEVKNRMRFLRADPEKYKEIYQIGSKRE